MDILPGLDVSLGQESWQSGEKRAFPGLERALLQSQCRLRPRLGGGRRGQGGLSEDDLLSSHLLLPCVPASLQIPAVARAACIQINAHGGSVVPS